MEDYTQYYKRSPLWGKYLPLLSLLIIVFVLFEIGKTISYLQRVDSYFDTTIKNAPVSILAINQNYSQNRDVLDSLIISIRYIILAFGIMNIFGIFCINYLLKKQYISSEKLDSFKREFISIISHELRTPLTSLSGMVYILKKQYEKDYRLQEVTYVETIQKQVHRITTVVLEMIESVRLSVVRQKFNIEKFGLNPLLQEAVSEIQPIAFNHKIRVDHVIDLAVVADRYRIKQVLIQLLDNAVKYSPPGLVVINSMKNGNKIIVSIRDFGSGIPRIYHKKIFDKYFQIRENRRKDDPNLGLGLYIAQEIVKRHGGDIWVDSTEGRGSIFYFTLPGVSN